MWIVGFCSGRGGTVERLWMVSVIKQSAASIAVYIGLYMYGGDAIVRIQRNSVVPIQLHGRRPWNDRPVTRFL